MAYKVIFFDLGGVLVNVDAQPAIKRLAEWMGWTPEETLVRWKSLEPITLAYEAGDLTTSTYLEYFKNNFKLSPRHAVDWFTGIFSLNHEVVKIAERLGSFYKLGIISNTNPLHFYRIMNDYYQLHLFQEPITSYYAKSLKPDQAIYIKAFRRFEVEPTECIFIDDRPENVQAAQRLGMHGILFRSAEQLLGDLKRSDVKVE